LQVKQTFSGLMHLNIFLIDTVALARWTVCDERFSRFNGFCACLNKPLKRLEPLVARRTPG
ncbi:MAG: hypothetical protein ABIP71_05595, partial [Verrucomicrobiota bacterium]